VILTVLEYAWINFIMSWLSITFGFIAVILTSIWLATNSSIRYWYQKIPILAKFLLTLIAAFLFAYQFSMAIPSIINLSIGKEESYETTLIN